MVDIRMPKRTTRRRFVTTAAAVAAASSLPKKGVFAGARGLSADDGTTKKLFFRQPATAWPDSLPVGNGRLGACVFGIPSLDRIQLKEESIWDGEPGRDRANPGAAAAVPRIRELLFAGKIAEAEALASSDMLSVPRRMPCYQTLGDLHLDFSSSGLTRDAKVDDYRLELNLESAVATTKFSHAGVQYRREVFSSAPDQVIVIHISASRAGAISFKASLDRPHNGTSKVLGEGSATGLRFSAVGSCGSKQNSAEQNDADRHEELFS